MSVAGATGPTEREECRDIQPAGSNVNAFGAVSYDFDATLYGFDLMGRAAGLD